MRSPPHRSDHVGILAAFVPFCLAASLASAAPGKRAPAAGESFSLALTGDSIITRKLSTEKDPALKDLLGIIRSADAAFTNLEIVLLDTPTYAMPSGPSLGADASLAKELAWAGFNLVSRANNHADDYGSAGIGATTRAIARAGLVGAGVGEDLKSARQAKVATTRGGRVALISAASTFPDYARASNPHGALPGRPGIDPLRFSSVYAVPRERLESLRAMLKELGLDPPPDGDLLGVGASAFVLGEKPEVRTQPREEDVREICAEVRRARTLADRVIVSIHSHESEGADASVPARFFGTAARAFIDAGADVVVGHGPHRLRGIEIYRGRPIFYSLGNFLFEYETVRELSSDDYEIADLSSLAKVDDFFDIYDRCGTQGYPADNEAWESVAAVMRWHGSRLAAIELYPITLGFGLPRAERGYPALAPPELGQTILQRLARLSEPFGTRIEFREGVGLVLLAEPKRPDPPAQSGPE